MSKYSLELINTGTELLLGNIVNTNAAWIGEQLFEIGLRLERQTTVPDGKAIAETMADAARRSDFVLVTGGLGPTSDDLTREALAEVCGVDLALDPEVLAHLRQYFSDRSRAMAPSNEKQAMVPQGASVIPNDYGTAPGLWMPSDGQWGHIILMPGPPRELKRMMENYVLPKLRQYAGNLAKKARIIKIAGMGESDLQDAIDQSLSGVPGLEFGYCARLGEVDIRLIGSDSTLDEASALIDRVLGKHVVKPWGASLEEAVVARLAQQGLVLTTAESCTGGLISKRITDVSGSSQVFKFGYVTYANEAKETMLGVPHELIEKHTEVSEPVAKAMAEGALLHSGADIAVAVTGFAGPSGGSKESPVGTVWMARAFKGKETKTQHAFYPMDRESFRMRVSQEVLACLLSDL